MGESQTSAIDSEIHSMNGSGSVQPVASRPATSADLPEIRRLLSDSDLPVEDIEQHIGNFIVATQGDVLVGCIAIEPLGTVALLRSLCVRPECRNRGVAAELGARIAERAARAGVRRLYLMTTTASEYFERAGFSICSRDEMPAEIQGTLQFRALCPATAVCMRRDLPGSNS